MKKILALILAALLLLGIGMAALADDPTDAPPTGTTPAAEDASVASELKFTKQYVVDAGSTTLAARFPAETLNFTIVAATNNPDNTMIAMKDVGGQLVDANPDEIVLTIPAYTKVGKYTYTVSEVAGNTQGVTYSTESFGVEVVVTYNEDHTGLQRQVVFYTGEDNKLDTITNVYKMGGDKDKDDNSSLTVTKTAEGNLADLNQKFDITVQFTAANPVLSVIDYASNLADGDSGNIAIADWKEGKTSVLLHIKHGETVTFKHIPEGVTYTVAEDAKHSNPDEVNDGDSATGYTTTYTHEETPTITAGVTKAEGVKNEKKTEVNTGVILDSLPYVLVLALVAAGVVIMIVRRRHRNDD